MQRFEDNYIHLRSSIFDEQMRTSQLSAARLKAEGGQSGTLAAHELISRVVKKYLYVWVSQDRCAVPQLKNLVWAGKESLKHPSCLLHELRCRRRSCAGFCRGEDKPAGFSRRCPGDAGLAVRDRSPERTCSRLETSRSSESVESSCAGLQGSLGSKCGMVGGVLEVAGRTAPENCC